jgi:DNA-binding NarL/FixJ family response regulator
VDFKTKPQNRGVGKIVLVVDDNPAIRKKLTAAFLSNGFKICAEAENGKKAIELASKVTPDIIVLDLSMPVMHALEAAPKLRKIFPDKPIILFTLHGDSLSKTEASKAGVSLVLSKTVPLAALVDKAHESVGG